LSSWQCAAVAVAVIVVVSLVVVIVVVVNIVLLTVCRLLSVEEKGGSRGDGRERGS